MTIGEAAISLRDHLDIDHQWIQAIGKGLHGGKPAIFVYVKKTKSKLSSVPKKWEGFPVVRRHVGRIVT